MAIKTSPQTALIVGTQSACGKTTIMLALLQYFQQKRCQTFKVGPDYLDPLWHQAVTTSPSYQLDTKMMGEALCVQQFNQHVNESDIVLIEGAMGLFDGATGVGERGSSAHLAKVLDVPVILVVNVKGMAGSIVPLVKGFYDYAHQLGITLSGIIANHVGSEHHAHLLETLLQQHALPPLIAWMKKEAPILPERHLGLKRPTEVDVPDFSPHFRATDSALFTAMKAPFLQSYSSSSHALLAGKTIAIAHDEACCFIYPANIDWLIAEGATVCYFSILNGESVPSMADGLWLPGGYPELYAETLANSTSLTAIQQFIEAGKPVLAECGGAMLLGKTLIDHQQQSWTMAGVFPYTSVMKNQLVSLGYRHETSGLCGHEFHHSTRIDDENLPSCFDLSRGDRGVSYKKVRASYIHWYFASAPEVITGWLT